MGGVGCRNVGCGGVCIRKCRLLSPHSWLVLALPLLWHDVYTPFSEKFPRDTK